MFLFSCSSEKLNKQDLKIFKYNQANGISSLDPAFARNQANIWATAQLFNGLVQVDENLAIKPSIAKSWASSEDGKSFTFILRDDVYFQNDDLFPNGKGRRVVASDFVYSFNRIIDKKVASTGAWIFNGKVIDNEPFKALNDSTFQIELKNAFRPILGILSMPYCFVVPKEVVNHYGKDFRAHPVGTGAFKLKVWEEGTALVALKNENYFETENDNKLPYLDGFKVTFIENKKMEFLNFMKGDLDMISGIDKSFLNQIFDVNGNLTSEYADKIELYKKPYLNTEYLGIKYQENTSPLQNKKLRQALNYCFNRKEMIQYLRKNIGYPASAGFVPKGLASFNEEKVKGYTFQPEKAKKLLKEANYTGEEIVLQTVESYKDIAMFISNQAKDVGLNIKVELAQSSILREWMSQGKTDFFRASWIADYPDAENYLSLFYSKNGAPPNYTRFSNQDFDLLYEKSLVENNDSIRFSYYHKMDSIVLDEATIVPLFYDEVMRFTQKGIENISPNAFNLLDLKRLRK
ncbi:MAG: ABC transporter substrate-binding protein [Chitinophagales bacterium]